MKNLFSFSFTRKLFSLLLFSVLFAALPLTAQITVPYVIPGITLAQNAIGVTEITSAAGLGTGTLASGWYAFSGTFTYNGTITVNGDVNLILEDGCNVTVNGASAGILVDGSNSLTIYSQTGATGKLTVNGAGGGAGIGGKGDGTSVGDAGGTITINGGNINATGRSGGAGIGGGGGDTGGGSGGFITVNGGVVVANGSGVTGPGNNGGAGAGIGGGGNTNTQAANSIGGSGGTIIINGGEVTATGGSESSSAGGAGIGGGGGTTGGSGGTIIIASGIVSAQGGNGHGGGAGIGGGGGINNISGSTGGDAGTIRIVNISTVSATGGTGNGGSVNFTGADIGSGGDGHNNPGTPYTDYGPAFITYCTIAVTQTTGGTITATPGGSTAVSIQVISGSSQAFSIIPSSGYVLSDVTVDGASVGTPSSYTFKNVTVNTHTITATFATAPTPTAITTVNTNVTAPATGGTPNTTATNGSNFTAGAVTWTPNDNPFLVNTEYTAKVTLTADANYTFTGLATATINGHTASFLVSTDGSTVDLSYTFPATTATGGGGGGGNVTGRIAPSMTLTASPVTDIDEDITLTAKVFGMASDPIATGKITFKQGDVELGTADLDASGVATFVCASPFNAGNGYVYTAIYPGDANYYGNTASTTVNVPVEFYLSDNYLNFIAAGETKPITVISNAGWSLEADASWAMITTADDGSHTMYVTAKPNSGAQRTMLFTFKAGTIVKTLRATQDGLNLQSIGKVDDPSLIVYSQDGNAIVKSDKPVQQVAVYDVSGKLLKVAKGGSNIVTISGLPMQQVLIVKVTNNELRVTSYKLRVE